jgi:hypothetical protein
MTWIPSFFTMLSHNSKVFPFVLKLMKATASRRRAKALAEVTNPFNERISSLHKRLEKAIKNSLATRYPPQRLLTQTRPKGRCDEKNGLNCRGIEAHGRRIRRKSQEV